ncbi:hypothetical protein JK358_14005 [Nocardia sp. 2]|uniref:HD domain-containing protein n=1 Tax=Nocardia acididurans TaxID=2802282 RepID=A0ABS1M4Q2_9NOCA|nr:hypothetical protein [Nocardia acididurans]MBL1075509.1 hypothetical protein [Nocardia acididurans]
MSDYTIESDPGAAAVAKILEHWTTDLGSDRAAYTNHAIRVLRLCDLLHLHYGGSADELPGTREEFVVAAAFHDLGVWTAHTFDYLPPSLDLSRTWLADRGESALIPLVSAMIDDHHKLRPAGSRMSPIELFRRADAIDASLGVVRFGLPRREYGALRRAVPDAGFHKRLAQLFVTRVRQHPLSPAPMLKW